ncbi:MAG: phosphoribosylformylglycinamidine synthase subunit PurQ [Bacteroidetes bacterium]|nr:phosphoribosylformylglycinamidine synthase subunit PurQ [Bacteroidota bacterium]MBU1718807.1 phosphoribosylformylglycinamidine synthase subunit PurQ [Bacteroidota bacterium]
MKFGVVIFPGSNCDVDMIYVLQTVYQQQVETLWHKDTSLKGCDFIMLPGGFSYGDYLRSGAIARFSPIMEQVIQHAERGGYLMGVCNGFQILCEAGLLPGALLHNENQKFVCRNTFIKAATTKTVITRIADTTKALNVPIAHAEGRYFAPKETLDHLQSNDQVLFHYCNKNGDVEPEANPNGSVLNIAGVCNEKRNVFGMMPHPERAADRELMNTDGCIVFDSILNSLL